MTRPLAQLNRFFVSPEFSVSYRRAKQLQWQTHATTGYSLLVALDGQLTYELDSQSFQLHPRRFVLFEPGAGITTNVQRAELLFLTFSASLVMQHAATMHLIPPKSTVTFKAGPLSGDDRLESLFAEFVDELTDEKPGKEIVMHALVEQLLVHVLRKYAQPRRSEELELSRAFHFARLFKKLTGSTPHNYLAGVRAARAQLLLAETELSVTEVGARVGYLSASHFTKAFRLATGTTPREFRKALIPSNHTSANERQ